MSDEPDVKIDADDVTVTGIYLDENHKIPIVVHCTRCVICGELEYSPIDTERYFADGCYETSGVCSECKKAVKLIKKHYDIFERLTSPMYNDLKEIKNGRGYL